MEASVTQRVVVVLGMHRSGTSVLTRALLEFGAYLGPDLMSSALDNPKGYWEDMQIYALNERLLQAIGLRWHSVGPIDPLVWQLSEVSALRLEALELVRERLSASPMWGFKDPRTARLLPFWNPVLQRANADVRYLIVYRNPLSVARSLSTRDGFAAEKSYLLWLEHLIPAMVETASARRVVVDYDSMLATPDRELRRIESALGLQRLSNETPDGGGYAAFLDASLRHAASRELTCR
jgi:hypothetical protein